MTVQLPVREKAFLVLEQLEQNWPLIRSIIKIKYKQDVDDIREAREIIMKMGELLKDDAYMFGDPAGSLGKR